MENKENVTTAPAAAPAPATAAPASRPFRPAQKRKRKVCIFCQDKIDHIDYKDVARLRKCTSERAKILPRLSLIHI